MSESLVWYAAYGSNLLSERLQAYLEGLPAPGRSVAERGSRDQRPPQEFRWMTAPYRLYFAGESVKWDGGGVAFVTPMPELQTEVHVRLALVTLGQFEDILAQENRRESEPVDLERAISHGRLPTGQGAYDLVLSLGHLDDRPVLTFTSPQIRPANPPAASYRSVIEAGLQSNPDLSDDAIREYLDAAAT